MDPTLAMILAALAGYVCGSIPFGYLAGKSKGADLRTLGSKNIGATNAGRVLGLRWFFIVFFLDLSKGFLPVFFAGQVAPSLFDAGENIDLKLPAAIGALLGHVFPAWLGFKGGKAVATGLGVMLGIHALSAAVAFAIFALLLAITRWVSLSSIIAALLAPVAFWYFHAEATFEAPLFAQWIFFIAAGMFILIRHRANVRRIIQGTEPKVGGKMPKVDR